MSPLLLILGLAATAARAEDRRFEPAKSYGPAASDTPAEVRAPEPRKEEPRPLSPNRPRRKGRVMLSLDIFRPANSGDGFHEDAQAAADVLAGVGYTVTGTVETKSAIGGRIGYMVPVADRVEVGASAGYLSGPDSKGTLVARAGGLTGNLAVERDVWFARFLGHATYRIPVTDAAAVRLGAGLGVATGRASQTVRCTGNACTGSSSDVSAGWTGLSWELSPELQIDRFLVGYKYAGFPRFKGSDGVSKMKWTTSSVYLGVAF